MAKNAGTLAAALALGLVVVLAGCMDDGDQEGTKGDGMDGDSMDGDNMDGDSMGGNDTMDGGESMDGDAMEGEDSPGLGIVSALAGLTGVVAYAASRKKA